MRSCGTPRRAHLAVAGRDAQNRLDLTGFGGILEAGADDVIGRHDAFQRRLNDLFRGGGDDVEGEVATLQILHQFHEGGDVLFKSDALANLMQMFAADAAVLGIVEQEVGELRALLHEMGPGQTGDFFLEIRGSEQFAQDEAGVVEAERLVEIRRQ